MKFWACYPIPTFKSWEWWCVLVILEVGRWRQFPGTLWSANLALLVRPSPMRDSISQERKKGREGEREQKEGGKKGGRKGKRKKEKTHSLWITICKGSYLCEISLEEKGKHSWEWLPLGKGSPLWNLRCGEEAHLHNAITPFLFIQGFVLSVQSNNFGLGFFFLKRKVCIPSDIYWNTTHSSKH